MCKCKIIVLGNFINALGITRALGKKKKYYLIAIGEDGRKNIVKWSKYLNEMVYRSKNENEIEILRKNKKNWENAHIIPTSDEMVRELKKNFEELSACYTMLVDCKTIDKIIDKNLFSKTCETAGIPFPKSYTSCNDINYPVIIKPVNESVKQLFKNKFGKGVLIINKSKDLKALGADFLEISIMQQYIPDKALYFTGGYCKEGNIESVFVAEKIVQRPPQGGDTIVAKSIHSVRLIEYSKRLLESIGYTGVFDIEFKYSHSAKDFYVIEMNPRSPKWIGFPEVMGVPIIEQAVDPTLKPTKTNYKEGKLWVDIHGMLANLIQYPSAWKTAFRYIYYLIAADYFAVLDKKDMAPFLKRR